MRPTSALEGTLCILRISVEARRENLREYRSDGGSRMLARIHQRTSGCSSPPPQALASALTIDVTLRLRQRKISSLIENDGRRALCLRNVFLPPTTQPTTAPSLSVHDVDQPSDVDRFSFGSDSVPGVPLDICRFTKWTRVVVGAFWKQAAIHNLEAATAVDSLRFACADPCTRGTTVIACDDKMSDVLASSIRRGRDLALNPACRNTCALQIAFDVDWARRRIPSEHSPTDSDSRPCGPRATTGRAAFRRRRPQEISRSCPRRASCRCRFLATRILLLFVLLLPGCAFLQIGVVWPFLGGACTDLGLRVAPFIDNRRDRPLSIFESAVQRMVLSWVRGGLISGIWFGKHLRTAPDIQRLSGLPFN